LSALNRDETAALRHAMNVMEYTAGAIRGGTVTSNHAEHLDLARKQIKAVWEKKGHFAK